MLQNKRFQSNENREVVSVLADNGVFYNLSNGVNIKKDIFFQKFSEMVDPDSFFETQSAAGLSDLVSQLKNVETSKMQDIGGNIPPTVRYRENSISEQVQAPQEYKDMLLRKYEQEQSRRDLSQYKVYENDDDAANDFEKRTKQTPPPPRQRPQYQNPEQYYEQNEQQYQQPEQIVNEQVQNVSFSSAEDESFRFFKSFKKVYPITLSVDFEERIAEPNFIKMMAVNYEGDIIKYYTKEFMNRIYNDPGFLENKIYEKLRSLVFEEDEVKEKKPRAPKKPTPPPVPVEVKSSRKKRESKKEE